MNKSVQGRCCLHEYNFFWSDMQSNRKCAGVWVGMLSRQISNVTLSRQSFKWRHWAGKVSNCNTLQAKF